MVRSHRLLVAPLVLLALVSTLVACDEVDPRPSQGLWISRADIAGLPMSGPAWNKVRAEAYDDWGRVDLSNNNSTHDTSTLAGALVAVRTGDTALRDEVRASLVEVSRTTRFARVLEMSRNIPAYVIAADLVGLEPDQDRAFRRFLATLPTKPLDGHSGGKDLLSTALRSPSNWGTMARAAMAAIALYLGDDVKLAQVAAAHRAYLGEAVRSQLVYTDTDWHADPSHKAGINRRRATAEGVAADGVLPEDQRRTGEPTGRSARAVPQGSYPWEALQGATVTAVLLHRAGVVSITAGDDALLRAFTWLSGANGNPAEGDDLWQPWVLNSVRGSHFATSPTRSAGKNMAWTDWTHAPGSTVNRSRAAG